MAGKLLPAKFKTKKESQGSGVVIGATEAGNPIHLTYRSGLSGQCAVDASKHHERKYQDHANQASHWTKMGKPGIANWHKGWASHHIKQSKRYSDDLQKSEEKRSRVKHNLESELKDQLM